MSVTGRRALHYVLKIGKRTPAINFFRNTLGMKVLRHEEFEQGCEATCNGPYDGKWSKTMIGYGSEDNNFVLELTYNYGISEYRHGNDFVAIEIQKQDISLIANAAGGELQDIDGARGYTLECNGYRFNIFQSIEGDRISRVILNSSNVAKSVEYYDKMLDLQIFGNDLAFYKTECKLQFRSLGEGVKLDRGQAFGRMAFVCPTDQLIHIEKEAARSKYGEKVQTPLVKLPTPGKADVQVVILADPDSHEICFVGDEGFRDLSKVDPKADDLLMDAIEADKSEEWFAKKGREKGKQLD